NAGEVLEALQERDEWRHKWPLMLVGLAASLLLLLGTFFLNSKNMNDTLHETHSLLIKEQQRQDIFTAQMAANVVGAELKRRTDAVRRHAGTDEFPSPQNKLVDAMKSLQESDTEKGRAEIAEMLSKYQSRFHIGMFSGWGIVSADGRMLAVYPDP